MEAGRELDALVAEKVTGWKLQDKQCPVCGWPYGASELHGCVPGNCSMRPPPSRRADTPQNYSTDIAAAWLVVEKSHILDKYSLTTHGANWVIVDETDGWDVFIEASTAPLAICLAALKAVGYTE